MFVWIDEVVFSMFVDMFTTTDFAEDVDVAIEFAFVDGGFLPP